MTTTKLFLLCLFLQALCGLGTTANCNPANKVDCGYVGINQQQCQAKGCCWQPVSEDLNKTQDTPWCFYPAGQDPCANLDFSFSGNVFSASEVATMKAYFLANINIQGKGGVVASPDTNVPGGGSYYYHWERDGALTMRTLQEISGGANITTALNAYTRWVLKVQNEADPNGIDVRTEPKYYLPDGAVYDQGWCRPQTDGPALRASALIMYANTLLAQGKSDYVRQYLWTGSSSYHGGAIKYDLDWIAANWTQDSCDLWEEVRSNDFFWNRFNFRYAMTVGATFAAKMGDSKSAATYGNVANSITQSLGSHYNQQFVYESSNRQKDSAVIVAFNEGYIGTDFGPTSAEVAGTIKTYNDLFCSEYLINQKDNQNKIPGILYGRYENDHYAGGNPWILSSASLAELFYRGASDTLKSASLPEPKAYEIWQSILNIPKDKANTLSHVDFAQLLASGGDSVLARIRYHVVGAGFHLSEQLDRNTGAECSATDLTWSYANVLKAIHVKTAYESLLKQNSA